MRKSVLGVREGEGRCGIGVGKCVSMWGKVWKSVWGEHGKYVWAWGGVRKEVGKGMGGVGENKGRCGGCKKLWGEVWKSVWGECGKVCWGVGEVRGKVCGVWGKVRREGGEEVWGEVWYSVVVRPRTLRSRPITILKFFPDQGQGHTS